MPDVVKITGQKELLPGHPFFSPEIASSLLPKLEGILPLKSEPIPLSADMPASPTLKRVFSAAVRVSHGIAQRPSRATASVSSGIITRFRAESEILMQAVLSREAVIAAIPKWLM